MRLRTCALWIALLSAPAAADLPRPASALFYPLHRSDTAFTLVSVTNSRASNPGVNAVFHYVNATPQANNPLVASCQSLYRSETLTPNDTVSVLTACHNGPAPTRGFLMVIAKSLAGCNAEYNHLIGSQVVVGMTGGIFALTPYAFEALPTASGCTDADADGRADFDGVEYEAMADEILLDSFLSVASSRLVLFNVSSSLSDDVTVHMDVFNDNEYPLSATFSFRCWFEMDLAQLSGVFTQTLLAGTPHDPDELDVNCDGLGDFETGWARIDPLVASGSWQSTANPAVLGAVTAGPASLDGGRLLWGAGTSVAGEL